jgi:hypothetical protein
MEKERSSEMLVSCQNITRCQNPEYRDMKPQLQTILICSKLLSSKLVQISLLTNIFSLLLQTKHFVLGAVPMSAVDLPKYPYQIQRSSIHNHASLTFLYKPNT